MPTTSSDLESRMEEPLGALRAKLASVDAARIPVSVLCIARHGFATTRVNLESLYEKTGTRFLVIYVDINSPPAARHYLEECAASREHFFHLRVDEFVSRQTARLLVLDMIPTRYTVFLDNNMLFSEGWLEALLRTAEAEEAAVVSPLIVMQGGNVHFSGSRLSKTRKGKVRRMQTTREAPMSAPLESCRPEQQEIDFGESHCCLVETECFRGKAAELFLEDMHNAHSMAIPTHLLKHRDGHRMLITPESVVSILPIARGYDFPWLFESYNNLEMLRDSYACHQRVVGDGYGSSLANLKWHRKHLLWLLWTMARDGNLENPGLIRSEEVPDHLAGYDKPLADGIYEEVQTTILPYLEAHHPEHVQALKMWIYEIEDVIGCIDDKIRSPGADPAIATRMGLSIVICTHNGARRLPAALRAVAALRNEDRRPWEVLLVDNGSTDGSAEAAEAAWPRKAAVPLRVIREPKLGLVHARLAGLAHASHEIISFIDDDNLVPEHWLDAVGRVMDAHPEAGVLGTSAIPLFDSDPPAWVHENGAGYAIGHQGDGAGDVTWTRGYVWGAGASFRAEALRAALLRFGEPVLVGRRGEGNFASGEDSELCMMVRALGWKIWLDPAIRIRHHIPPERLNWPYLRRLHRGFGAAALDLARYRLPPPAERSQKKAPKVIPWPLAILKSSRRIWRRRRHVLRMLKGKDEGDPRVLEVEAEWGFLRALLKAPGRYRANMDFQSRLSREVPDRCAAAGGRDDVLPADRHAETATAGKAPSAPPSPQP
ncbi:MAG: glycosyltransferase [Akkermansiaceae bacterium]|nr:glycosyltransferase [Akkermansiaceae bacterium]